MANAIGPVVIIEKVEQELLRHLISEEEVLVFRIGQYVVEHAGERDNELANEATDQYNTIVGRCWVPDIIYL